MTRNSLLALGLLGCVVALWFAIVPRPGEVARATLPDGVLASSAGASGGRTASRATGTQLTIRAEGPIAERKATFAKESRDSAAASTELAMESAFRQPDVPAALFQHVQCRQTICKLELRWSEDRSAGYMAAMMRTFANVAQQFAVEPLGIPDKSGEQVVDVYIQRTAQPKTNGK